MDPISLVQDKRLVLGVTGSIAAYKAADLASKLTQAGAQVDVILTEAAQRFVSALTFQAVTGRETFTDLWTLRHHIPHVSLGQTADLLIIAPASAHTLAKLATGEADNLLLVTALALRCPLLLAPAMDGSMFNHPATQANLATLRERGAVILGPAEGRMASGLVGLGRMVEPAELLGHIRLVLARSGLLSGKKIVVTAGGTQEPLDPVRFISNRSSGRQGFALAQAALDAGAEVILISAPVSLETPIGARRIDVRTAVDMADAVLREISNADALLMAAAVADFRPVRAAEHKIKKETTIPTVELEHTEDILGRVAEQRPATGHPRMVVGFAAETRDLLANARQKLARKRLDLVVANDVSAADSGFEVSTNRVTMLTSSGDMISLGLMSKVEVAEEVVRRVADYVRASIQGNERT